MHPYRIIREFDPVRVQVQLGPATDADYRAFLAEQDTLIQEARRSLAGSAPSGIVLIIDASCDIVPPPTQRKMQAEWLKANGDVVRASTLGSFVVVPGALARAGLTALFWLVPTPIPITPVGSLEEAVTASMTLLRAQGNAPPPILAQYGVAPVAAAIQRLKARPAA